jgi:hypothetical protein
MEMLPIQHSAFISKADKWSRALFRKNVEIKVTQKNGWAGS